MKNKFELLRVCIAGICLIALLAMDARAQDGNLESVSEIDGITNPKTGPTEEPELRQLFLPGPKADLDASRSVHTTISSQGTLNFELLNQLQRGSRFEVELAGEKYQAFVEVSKTQMYGLTVKGILAETPGSFFTISTEGEFAAGAFLLSRGRMFHLSYGGAKGVHYLAESSEPRGRCRLTGVAAAPEDGKRLNDGVQKLAGPRDLRNQANEGIEKSDTPATANATSNSCAAIPPVQFDIAMAYTRAARIRVGATAAIRTECMTAVTMAEETFQNSGLSIQVNLVGLAEVNYNENPTMDQDLEELVDGIGALQQARDLRTNTGADFLALVVSEGEPTTGGVFLGIATCPHFPGLPSRFWFDYSSVNAVRRTASESLNTLMGTLVHEMGHNVGCGHTSGACDPTRPNARGLSTSTFQTIMGDEGPADRISNFSNPNVLYQGNATGTASRNNVSVISRRERVIESSMDSRLNVFVDLGASGSENGSFQNPFDTVLEGVNQTLPNPVADLPELQIRAGTYNESLIITKPMIIKSCGGTATIGN